MARLGLGGQAPARFADGSLPVYAVGEQLVLKLYPPPFLGERELEADVLSAVAGRLPIPTPEVRETGTLEGWGYVLMSRLRGRSLALAWPEIPEPERLELASGLGAALAALHAVPAPRLDAVRVDWPSFLAEQRASAVERQRRRGLEAAWLAQIPDFLDAVSLEAARPTALLHTEVMREHLLAEPGPAGWVLTGLLDFEPAMAGAAEYEFASVGLFFACGRPRLLRRVLLGYGYAGGELDERLSRRLMAYGLLHRYSNLPWYLRRLPPPAGIRTLDELALHWWGLEEREP